MSSCLHRGRVLPAMLFGAIWSGIAFADTQSFTDSIALQTTNWNGSLTVPKFNPALGTLQSVSIAFTGTVETDAQFESTDAAPQNVSLGFGAEIRLFRSDNPAVVLLQAAPTTTYNFTFAAFDGTLDFAGPSGANPGAVLESASSSASIPPPPADLALFVGPGNITFPARAQAITSSSGSGNVVTGIATRAAANIVVQYTFLPLVDCNNNGVQDTTDITSGTSTDCDANGVPDECQPDCNNDGTPDACEVDSDGDGVPDECDAPTGPCESKRSGLPGSLLLYPEFDNRDGSVTFITVTNTQCAEASGVVDVEFVYIARYGINGVDLPCLETNRTMRLTPCDTVTIATKFHNPNAEQGYVYAFAKSPTTGRPIVFNHLIGQLFISSALEGADDTVNARVFRGVGTRMAETDVDNDGIRDLDGVEYDEAPDRILIPRFLGQRTTYGPERSKLILIGLSGGADFSTVVDMLVYNDNEQVLSKQYQFRCWADPYLTQIDPLFLNSFLSGLDHAANEIVGAPNQESGWIQLNGRVAFSSAAQINDPAIYAVLVERLTTQSVVDLPYEECLQDNGDLLPNGPLGDQ